MISQLHGDYSKVLSASHATTCTCPNLGEWSVNFVGELLPQHYILKNFIRTLAQVTYSATCSHKSLHPIAYPIFQTTPTSRPDHRGSQEGHGLEKESCHQLAGHLRLCGEEGTPPPLDVDVAADEDEDDGIPIITSLSELDTVEPTFSLVWLTLKLTPARLKNPTHDMVWPDVDTLTAYKDASFMNFVPGLYQVLRSESPPSLDRSKMLPLDNTKAWGVYLLVLERPASRPKRHV